MFERAGPVALVVLAVAVAYGGVLDNFFFPMDDPQVLACAREGTSPTQHFRPLQELWNEALLALFGAQPAGWYAVGLAVHALNALLVAHLALSLTRSRAQALAAGLAFAVAYSPHQAVLWIAANGGPLAVLFGLLAVTAWDAARVPDAGGSPRRALAYAGALVALAIAMGMKEDAVLVGPLFLAVDVAAEGWRALPRLRTLRRFAPVAALTTAHLALAFRPSLWADRPGVGMYEIGPGLVPKLFQNFAWLFWPRDVDASSWTSASTWVGVGLAAAAVVLTPRTRGRFVLLPLGLAVALAGLMPTLPGPFAVAGSRFAYPSSIGIAWMAAAVFGIAFGARPRIVRALACAGLAVWIAAQTLSLRSVESWRYDANCSRFRTTIESSHALVDAGEAVLVRGASPWNEHLRVALQFWHGVSATLEWTPYEGATAAATAARFAPGGDLDPAEHAVFTAMLDGTIVRARSAADVFTMSLTGWCGMYEPGIDLIRIDARRP